MNFPPLQYIAKFCRRRPWLSATVFGFIFLTFVPVWPYTPKCGMFPGKNIDLDGPMSADYRTSLKTHFGMYGVYYWDIGGVILLRLFPFMDGDKITPQSVGIFTANNDAAWALASKHYIGTFVGQELNGRIYQAPGFIEALRNPKTQKFDTGMCSFMAPVVMGKPVERAPSITTAE